MRTRKALLCAIVGVLAAVPSGSATAAGVTTVASGLSYPGGVGISASGHVFLTARHFVREYDASANLIRQFGSEGTGNGQFEIPTDVAIGGNGEIFVADNEVNAAGRVQRFDAAGGYLSTFSPTSQDFMQLVFDGSGHLWANGANQRIVKEYDPMTGAVLASWPAGDSQSSPFDLAFAPDGNLWVLVAPGSTSQSHVERRAPDGTLLGSLPASVGIATYALATDVSGDVYVGSLNTITHYRPDGSVVGRFDVQAAAPSTHDWYVNGIAVASDGRIYASAYSTSDDGRLFSIDPRTPLASLTTPASVVATGSDVPFDASKSSVPMSSIKRYEWDLDGDGSFEADSGTTPTVTHSYATRGPRTIRVRVTSPTGETATASVDIDVRQTPPPGAVGVSVNNGAQFTNDPNVSIAVVWPALAKSLTLANDGGFGGSSTFDVEPQISWLLDSSGPERLPKTVYVRFDGGTQTFTDDIILDQVPPAVSGATASAATPTAARASAASYKIVVNATDDNSGVGDVQFGASQSSPGAVEPASADGAYVLAALPKFVRVRDRAGNFSAWRAVATTSAQLAAAKVKRGKAIVIRYTVPNAGAISVKLIRGTALLKRKSFEVDAGSGSLRMPTKKRFRKGTYKVRVKIGAQTIDLKVKLV